LNRTFEGFQDKSIAPEQAFSIFDVMERGIINQEDYKKVLRTFCNFLTEEET
jgi:Ca2+-binding EF-hand superfamily protein